MEFISKTVPPLILWWQNDLVQLNPQRDSIPVLLIIDLSRFCLSCVGSVVVQVIPGNREVIWFGDLMKIGVYIASNLFVVIIGATKTKQSFLVLPLHWFLLHLFMIFLAQPDSRLLVSQEKPLISPFGWWVKDEIPLISPLLLEPCCLFRQTLVTHWMLVSTMWNFRGATAV